MTRLAIAVAALLVAVSIVSAPLGLFLFGLGWFARGVRAMAKTRNPYAAILAHKAAQQQIVPDKRHRKSKRRDRSLGAQKELDNSQ